MPREIGGSSCSFGFLSNRSMERGILFALTAFALAICAWSQSVGSPVKAMPQIGYPGASFEGLKEFLSLTDSQVQQLQVIQRSRQAGGSGDLSTNRREAETAERFVEFRFSGSPCRWGRLKSTWRDCEDKHQCRFRPKIRAAVVLTDTQRAKLVELETALRLQRAGSEAVGLGLIEPLPPPAGRAPIQQ